MQSDNSVQADTLMFLPATGLTGVVTVPGDKSITHRAVLFGLLAEGQTRIRGWLDAADCRSSIRVAEQLGACVEKDGLDLVVTGTGSVLQEPDDVLDCGNSGTTMRLLMGALAARVPFACVTGDGSLRKRPMKRVFDPLSQMGAEFFARSNRFAPFSVTRNRLHGITYDLPMASAQVKSAVLIAGLLAEGETVVREPAPTRDHTELMLTAFGARVTRECDGLARAIKLEGGQSLRGTTVHVPGDVSSAAFLLAAAAIIQGGHVTVAGVGLNSTRCGFLNVMERMGALVSISNRRTIAGEEIGDVTVVHSRLEGVSIGREEIPTLIDELPLVAILGAYASGKTVVKGAEELRVKETDRISAVAEGLQQIGVQVEELRDGFVVHGGNVPRGGTVDSHHDHRIAMSFAVAGLASREGVRILHWSAVEISYPDFAQTLQSLGAATRQSTEP